MIAQCNDECYEEVKNQADWEGWEKVTVVRCDRKIASRVKGGMYESVVKPVMMYGLKTVKPTEKQKAELQWLR